MLLNKNNVYVFVYAQCICLFVSILSSCCYRLSCCSFIAETFPNVFALYEIDWRNLGTTEEKPKQNFEVVFGRIVL